MIDQLPPTDIDAEAYVLGACMNSMDAMHDAMPLSPADFWNERHQLIFDIMRNHEIYDPQGIASAARGKLEDSIRADYLIGLTLNVPSFVDVRPVVARVKEMSIRRRIKLAASRWADSAMRSVDMHTLLQKIEEEAQYMAEEYTSGFDTTQGARDVALDLLGDVKHWQQNPAKVRGYATGLTLFDYCISGFQPSLLYYVCGRPGMGKSALLARMAWGLGKNGVPVQIFALEMTKKAMMLRMACQMAHVSSTKAKHGELLTVEVSRLDDALDQLSRMPIFIEDRPGMTIRDMEAVTRRQYKQHDLGVVMVDTLNLVASDGKTPYERTTLASRSMKDWAHSSPFAVVGAAQLSRANQQFSDKRPTLASLRDSGAIEEDGDAIFGVHRESAYKWDDPSLEHQSEILVLKQREGEAFHTIKLYWEKSWPGFENAEITNHKIDEEDQAILGMTTH